MVRISVSLDPKHIELLGQTWNRSRALREILDRYMAVQAGETAKEKALWLEGTLPAIAEPAEAVSAYSTTGDLRTVSGKEFVYGLRSVRQHSDRTCSNEDPTANDK
jgi:hypothetical protein